MAKTNLLAAFLGGAAAGAVVGLLLAPQSGEETRKQIAKAKDRSLDQANDLIKEGKRTWNDTRGRVVESAGLAADEIDDFVRHILDRGQKWWNKARRKADDVADDAEGAMRSAKRKARNLADDAEDVVDKGTRKARNMADDAEETVDKGMRSAKEVGNRVSDEAHRVANNVKESQS